MTDIKGAPGWKIALALGTVYVIWGSTYLAILFAIATLPPFWMAAVRFLTSGALLYAWARWRGAPRPERVHWRSAALIGGLLLVGGNGAVVWSEQRLESGIAALLVSTVPLWMVLFEWLRKGGTRPTLGVVAGLALGFAGLVMLVKPGRGGGFDAVAIGILLLGCASWAWGSLRSRHVPLPESPLLATGMEMLSGGAIFVVLGLLTGEAGQLDLAGASLKSGLALGYLVVFGALGFTAYIWLLRVTTPALVSTYAYVNPVVAVFLGWALAGEPLTGKTLGAAAVILTGVALITVFRNGNKPPRRSVALSSAHDTARAHPQLLDHRPHRPRQVDAGRPNPGKDPGAVRAGDDGPGARRHGPRARARHHDQGEGREALL